MRAWVCQSLAVGLLAVATNQSAAAERVGEAVLVKTSVTGDGRTLATKSPVHRDERIRTSSTGLAEFVFRDGTKFAVGWNSSVVIDEFVFDDSKSVKNLSVKAAKGSFRWISGGAKSSAYQIATPAGTIGIRGTAFDLYVGAGGVTAVVLMKGAVQFCGANGCRDLRRRCDYVVATPGGGVSDPARVSRDAVRRLRNAGALPFMTGNQRLSRRFQVGNDCLSTASASPNRSTPSPSNSSPSEPSPSPSPSPGKGNNGKGNGGGDGSPNGKHGDTNR